MITPSLLHPNITTSPICRACHNEKEETSHLFAYCEGLAQLRVKSIGSVTLPGHFTWTPHQLLTLIKEIDKVCPEEETPDTRLADLQTADNHNATYHE
jgi:hypothetical protein